MGAVPGDAVGPGQTPAGHGDDDVDEQDDREADADHGPNKDQKLGQETSQAESEHISIRLIIKIRQHYVGILLEWETAW